MQTVEQIKTELKTLQRFNKYVEFSGACWLWTGGKNSGGYGTFHLGHTVDSHRFAHEFFKGPIPPDIQIDHLCRVRNCVNPDHLEAVTQQENIKRGVVGIKNRNKTHCPQGHEYAGDNLYTRPKVKGRYCKKCNIAAYKKHIQQIKGDNRCSDGETQLQVSQT